MKELHNVVCNIVLLWSKRATVQKVTRKQKTLKPVMETQ